MALLISELTETLVRDFRERSELRPPVGLPPGVVRLTGGLNNGVYRVDADTGRLCVKVYRSDDRQRGDREWRALSFLRSHDSSFTPCPYERLSIDGTIVVLMEFLPGSHLGEAALSPQQQGALVERIQWLHGLPHTPERLPEGVSARERIVRLQAHLESATAHSAETSLGLQLMGEWLAGPDGPALQQPGRRVFSRLDTSLANALWDGVTLRLVDFEYAGWLAPCLDLAEQVEHVQSRGTSDEVWKRILERIDADGVTEELKIAGQRLLVLEWLQRFWPADDRCSPNYLPYLHRAERLCRHAR